MSGCIGGRGRPTARFEREIASRGDQHSLARAGWRGRQCFAAFPRKRPAPMVAHRLTPQRFEPVCLQKWLLTNHGSLPSPRALMDLRCPFLPSTRLQARVA